MQSAVNAALFDPSGQEIPTTSGQQRALPWIKSSRLENRFKAKFVRRYGTAFEDQVAAIAGYARDTRAGTFPSEDESYLANDQLTEALGLYGSSRR